MPDKAFIGTNVLIYFISSDDARKATARDVLLTSPETLVSSQVINEFISTCLQKRLLSLDEVNEVSNGFMRALQFSPVDAATINSALKLVKKYKLGQLDYCIRVGKRLHDALHGRYATRPSYHLNPALR